MTLVNRVVLYLFIIKVFLFTVPARPEPGSFGISRLPGFPSKETQNESTTFYRTVRKYLNTIYTTYNIRYYINHLDIKAYHLNDSIFKSYIDYNVLILSPGRLEFGLVLNNCSKRLVRSKYSIYRYLCANNKRISYSSESTVESSQQYSGRTQGVNQIDQNQFFRPNFREHKGTRLVLFLSYKLQASKKSVFRPAIVGEV